MVKQDLTGASGASVTLSHPVANANEVELYINNVRQEPTTSYTTSGTTLSFVNYTVAASDDIYVIFLGKALQTTVPPDGSVSTAKIADGAVNLTTKVNSVLPITNGGTGATSYNAPAMVLLTTKTGNGVGELDITTGFSSTYDTYYFTFVGQPSTDGANAFLRVFTDQSGSSLDTTGMFGRETYPFDGGSIVQADNGSDTLAQLNRYGIRAHANMGIQGSGYILNRNSTSIMFSVNGHANYIQTGTSNHNMVAFGGVQTTDVNRIITGLRFTFSGGNVNNGTLKLYGIT
tara:strand:+ start:27540 stop:28406 length:867 start_codon:yes stop_codon:yes gene_type:complete